MKRPRESDSDRRLLSTTVVAVHFQALCKSVQYGDIQETMELVFSGAEVSRNGASLCTIWLMTSGSVLIF